VSLLRSIYEKVQPRRVVPPMPAQHVAKVEHPEEDSLEPRPGRESGYAMVIDYVDTKGTQSFRRISCRRVEIGTGTIHAYCLERSGWRSFKLDGISLPNATQGGVGTASLQLRRYQRQPKAEIAKRAPLYLGINSPQAKQHHHKIPRGKMGHRRVRRAVWPFAATENERPLSV
jgi:hypothetical protein